MKIASLYRRTRALPLVASVLLLQIGVLLPLQSMAQSLPPLIQPGQSTYTDPYTPNATNLYQTETLSLRGRISTIPTGTMLMARVDQPVSASTSKLGETIYATLENDIFINDTITIPAGSQVLGHVAVVDAPGHMGKHGSLDIRFDAVKLPNGSQVPIRAHISTEDKSGILKGDTYTKDVIKGVGVAAGGAGLGTLAGLSAGSLIGSAGAGAVFGLGVGALGGMGYAVARKGHDVQIPSGSRMSIILDAPVSVNL